MAHIHISEDVRPISDLKGKAAEIVRQISHTGRPVVLTRHGRGVAVVLSVEEYELLQEAAQRLRLISALGEGENDISAGRTISHDEMVERWTTVK